MSEFKPGDRVCVVDLHDKDEDFQQRLMYRVCTVCRVETSYGENYVYLEEASACALFSWRMRLATPEDEILVALI